MIIGIDMGHTLRGKDTGATGCGKREELLTREVGSKVITKLQSLGHTVVNCTTDESLNVASSLEYRVNKANKYNVDLFASIHFNSYNGQAYGTEVWTYGGKQFVEATKVLNNLVGLGYTNRGVKDGSGLYVLKHTKMKSMLIECCFIDNAADMAKYNPESIANAIVKGLVGTTVSTPSKTATNSNNSEWQNLDGKTGIINTPNGVNIRAGKSTSAKILGTLANGAKVNLYRQEGEWLHIYYPPHGGYIYSKYVKY